MGGFWTIPWNGWDEKPWFGDFERCSCEGGNKVSKDGTGSSFCLWLNEWHLCVDGSANAQMPSKTCQWMWFVSNANFFQGHGGWIEVIFSSFFRMQWAGFYFSGTCGFQASPNWSPIHVTMAQTYGADGPAKLWSFPECFWDNSHVWRWIKAAEHTTTALRKMMIFNHPPGWSFLFFRTVSYCDRWRFPELGVAPVIIHFNGISMKSTIQLWATSMAMETPISTYTYIYLHIST